MRDVQRDTRTGALLDPDCGRHRNGFRLLNLNQNGAPMRLVVLAESAFRHLVETEPAAARLATLYDRSVSDSADFAAFAALLRRGRDIPDMVNNLAERLERALPGQVETSRDRLRHRVRSVVIGFNPTHFRIEVRGSDGAEPDEKHCDERKADGPPHGDETKHAFLLLV